MNISNFLIVVSIIFSVSNAGCTQNCEYCCANSVCQSKQECLYSLQLFLIAVVCFIAVCCCLCSIILWLRHLDVRRKYNILAKNRIEADLLKRNTSCRTIEVISNTFLKMSTDGNETNNVLRDEIRTIGVTFKSRNDILTKNNLPGVKLIKENVSCKSFEELKNDLIKIKKLHMNAYDTKETIGFENLKRYINLFNFIRQHNDLLGLCF